MTHRRPLPVILVLSGLLLSACASASPAAPPKTGRQLVLERLRAASEAPYSAALDAVTRSEGKRLQHMYGRINLNAPLTGRTTDVTEHYTEDVVMTRQHVYRRAVGAGGAWQVLPAAAAKGGIPVDRLPRFVRLILDHGGRVHQREGEPVRVSGKLTPRQIETVDRTSGRNLRSVTTVDAEVWVDEEGRVVRVREGLRFADGPLVRNTITLSGFQGPVAVARPGVARSEHRLA
ncbi:hypothetical protein [Streptomyces sp. WG-D5]